MGFFGKKRDSDKKPLEKVIGYKGKGGWFSRKNKDDDDDREGRMKRLSGGYGNISS